MKDDFRSTSGLAAVTLALVLWSTCACKAAGRTQNQGNEALDSRFFSQDSVGRKIDVYLHCVDFDCVEKLEVLVKSGSESVNPLIRLLQYGVTAEVGRTLPGDASLLVRVKAINALAALRDRRAVPGLISVLQDSRPLVRATAAEALGKLGGNEAFNRLLRCLEDTDELVRENTAKALQGMGRQEALGALRTAAQNESKAHVRTAMEAAIKVLERP
ncbi:MAG TPA: HEAT repeat domain-containing protein [Terriglobia bacterium]|nr:HEAT repeat domain-containing protein [Terriglobia bacterium]